MIPEIKQIVKEGNTTTIYCRNILTSVISDKVIELLEENDTTCVKVMFDKEVLPFWGIPNEELYKLTRDYIKTYNLRIDIQGDHIFIFYKKKHIVRE